MAVSDSVIASKSGALLPLTRCVRKIHLLFFDLMQHRLLLTTFDGI